LTKGDPHLDNELRVFLSRTYNLKAIADYETGSGSEISAERAAAAVKTARQFLACFTERLGAPLRKQEE
jgi:uncharacterized protein (UPF0332 family)